MILGTTFVNLNQSSYQHLWVVVTDPSPEDSVVIFNLTTKVDGCDQACLVVPADHPWVKHDSYVAYLRGREIGRPAWDLMNKMGLASFKAPASTDLVRRIQHGCFTSPFTAPKLQELVRVHLIP